MQEHRCLSIHSKFLISRGSMFSSNHTMSIISQQQQQHVEIPMSRTHQYRKVMKPLLERKRRARINKCLDELKDLMVFAMQTEGEAITKLEKADILEITVKYLQKLKQEQILKSDKGQDRYTEGYAACASEVGKCLANFPGVDFQVGVNIMKHLGTTLPSLKQSQTSSFVPLSVNTISSSNCSFVRPSCGSPGSDDCGYNSGRESTPSPQPQAKVEPGLVWRPF